MKKKIRAAVLEPYSHQQTPRTRTQRTGPHRHRPTHTHTHASTHTHTHTVPPTHAGSEHSKQSRTNTPPGTFSGCAVLLRQEAPPRRRHPENTGVLYSEIMGAGGSNVKEDSPPLGPGRLDAWHGSFWIVRDFALDLWAFP